MDSMIPTHFRISGKWVGILSLKRHSWLNNGRMIISFMYAIVCVVMRNKFLLWMVLKITTLENDGNPAGFPSFSNIVIFYNYKLIDLNPSQISCISISTQLITNNSTSESMVNYNIRVNELCLSFEPTMRLNTIYNCVISLKSARIWNIIVNNNRTKEIEL